MQENILIIITFIVLIGAFITFIKEQLAPHLVALTGMIILLIAGAISTDDMLAVFSNSAPITIACMFVISAALDQTGVVDTVGNSLLKISNKSKYLGIIAMILVVVFVSAFMNNTPVVIILTPVIIALAKRLKDYPSKYLIPLSYAAIMGGTCTLIGTSTNILVNGIAQEYGQRPFGMFEITGAGLAMATAGLIFMALVGRFLLPERQQPQDDVTEGPVKRFMAAVIIPLDSPLIGKSINEIKFTDNEDYEIIDLVRKDTGTRMTQQPATQITESIFNRIFAFKKEVSAQNEGLVITAFRDIKLKGGDRLIFRLSKDEIIELQKHIGIEFDTGKAHFSEPLPTRAVIVAEGTIPPTSRFIGMRVKDLKLRRGYGAFAIAVHRKDKNITGNLPNLVLKEGDSLILEGTENELDRLFAEENILNASFIRHVVLNKSKAPIAIATIVSVVGLSALNVMPIAGLAMIGAILTILTGCVTMEKAYRTIDWRIMLLIFGMLGLGTAMDNTGAAALLVNHAVALVDGLGPIFLLVVVYMLTSILTEMITNNAVAIILTPIVIGLATTLGYDARPFIVAVMMAASASFATPIGYQTNTFVYAAGGYKFKDFLKIGIPMNIIRMIVVTSVIPLFWPF